MIPLTIPVDNDPQNAEDDERCGVCAQWLSECRCCDETNEVDLRYWEHKEP